MRTSFLVWVRYSTTFKIDVIDLFIDGVPFEEEDIMQWDKE